MPSAETASTTMRSPANSAGYRPQLDGLRGVAILSVLLHHFQLHPPPLLDWGPVGVRVFFLLSGFLITGSLLRLQAEARGGTDLGGALFAFHARRILRITPVLYLMIAIGCFLELPEFTEALGWHLAFLSNVYAVVLGDWPGAASHLWSLAVQEQFYVAWPFLILAVPRRWLPAVLVGLVLLAPAYRATLIMTEANPFARWVLLPGVIDSFALGALLCLGAKSGHLERLAGGRGSAIVAGLAVVAFAAARGLRLTPFAGPWAGLVETLENAFLGWLVLRTAVGWRGWMGRLLGHPVLTYVGRISFGLYVFHVLVHVSLAPWLAPVASPVVSGAVLVLLSIAVASVSYRYLEAPLSAWVRDRAKAASAATVPTA